MNTTRLTVSLLALLGLVHTAQAADYREPILRGSEVFAPAPATYFRWSGVYFGGQGGYTAADVNFGTGARAILDDLIIESQGFGQPELEGPVPVALKDSVGASSYGGFIGYNSQWENLVVGIEGNYNRTSINLASTETIAVQPPNVGTATAISTAHLTDYGTLRARAGLILGRFLPYAMVGLAIGRADFTDSARLQYTPVVDGVPQPAVDVAGTARQTGTIGYGFAAGFGVDVMLTAGIFVRGEYEFIQFTSFGSTPILDDSTPPLNHKVTLNTVRGAVGFKF